MKTPWRKHLDKHGKQYAAKQCQKAIERMAPPANYVANCVAGVWPGGHYQILAAEPSDGEDP